MLEPPDLGDEQLTGALEAAYGTRVAALAFLPIGNDPASWSYRVEQAAGPARFLKIRAGRSMPGAAVPAHLRRHRVPNVLAPLLTTTGQPFAQLDRFAIALYPLLEASTGAGRADPAGRGGRLPEPVRGGQHRRPGVASATIGSDVRNRATRSDGGWRWHPPMVSRSTDRRASSTRTS
jgi:hypothetical protein